MVSSKANSIDDRYLLLGEIGRDLRGVSYAAQVRETGEVVQLCKLRIAPASAHHGPAAEPKFPAQALLDSGLRHPNIVRILSLGQDHGAPYVVSEITTGLSLAFVLSALQAKAQAIEESAVLHLVRQVVQGLGHAHRHGIAHLCLGPDRVIIQNNGVVQVDGFFAFPAARFGPIDHATVLAQVPCPAPEGLPTEYPQAYDFYALGRLCLDMLGKASPQGPHAPSSSSDMQPDLSKLIARCIEADPSKRLSSAEDFLAELQAIPASGGTTLQQSLALGSDPVLAELVDSVSSWRLGTLASATPRAQSRVSQGNDDRAAQNHAVEETLLGDTPVVDEAWILVPGREPIALDKAIMRLGRRDKSHEILPDIAFEPRWVHRRYVRFERHATGWVICWETGATQNVTINGKTLDKYALQPLHDGDEIVLGQAPSTISMVFHYSQLFQGGKD